MLLYCDVQFSVLTLRATKQVLMRPRQVSMLMRGSVRSFAEVESRSWRGEAMCVTHAGQANIFAQELYAARWQVETPYTDLDGLPTFYIVGHLTFLPKP